MSRAEQEAYLVRRLQEIFAAEDETRSMLAKVRGGYKYEASTEIDRPDLLELKGESA